MFRLLIYLVTLSVRALRAIYAYVDPYGYFELDMETRLPLEQRRAA